MPAIDYMDCFPTGPGTIAGRYMRKFWRPVQHAEDINPGWAKPIRIMSEDFTLYRGDSGRPQAVEFRCPHRQSQLSVGWVEGDALRCRRGKKRSPRESAFVANPLKNISA